MLKGMSLAEASAHTDFLTTEEAEERLWQLWLTGAGNGKSFEDYKAQALSKKAGKTGLARRISADEEAATLAFAAQFVRFKGVDE